MDTAAIDRKIDGRPFRAFVSDNRIVAVLWWLLGVLLLLVALADAFETVVLPRHSPYPLRLSEVVLLHGYRAYSALAKRAGDRLCSNLLFVFGPAALVILIAIWVVCIIAAFGLMHLANDTRWNDFQTQYTYYDHLYASGVNFTTLGLGDMAPRDPIGKVMTVSQAVLGLGFFALIVGYIPSISGAVAHREVGILRLSAKAGDPPTARTLLERYVTMPTLPVLGSLLSEYEAWAAHIHTLFLAYPVLAAFRSQHRRHSWLRTLTVVLDTCALLDASLEDRDDTRALLLQSEATFESCQHVARDLARMLHAVEHNPAESRLDLAALDDFLMQLSRVGLPARDRFMAWERLQVLTAMYEPYVQGLEHYLVIELPRGKMPSLLK